jgi:threonine synthase
MRIGTVNSINWARVAAQIVYYFKAYFAATRNDGEQVSFAVPSGNFGNILAGHVARRMGLPIRHLILATNENDVLDEFVRSGRYRVRRPDETLQTSSPSMDISKASNFERFIFDLADRDTAKIRELWNAVESDGGFDLSGTPLEARLRESGFLSGRSTHADRLATIRAAADNYRIVVDPHTADGIKVGLEKRENGIPLICIETALPAKFAATIREALGREAARPAAYAGIEERPQRYSVLPPDVAVVKSYITERAA